MRDKCISAVEFFTRTWSDSPETKWIKKNFPAASMREFYATCNNVALLWWALGRCRLFRDKDTMFSPRGEQLIRAMTAFKIEFYSNGGLYKDLLYADKYLSKAELKRWANRLREYVTPR